MATATGRWPFALLDEPVWQLLWVFHHLNERDARRAVEDRAARVDAGFMAALAFNQPASLDDELRRVQSAMDALDYETSVSDPARLRSAGAALAQRIAAGKVLSPAALLPDGGLVS